jgi:hypothetical protein
VTHTAAAVVTPRTEARRTKMSPAPLLFAAQGGTALHNAEIYGACRQMTDNLQAALEGRAIIEQAKGVLHAKLAVSPDEAFELLRRSSQNTNQKVRVIAGQLVRGEIDPRQLRSQAL